MRLVIRKSNYTGKLQNLMTRRGDKSDDKIERFRKLILDHLSKQEDEEGGVSKVMQKALNFIDKLSKGGKGLAIGAVREWKGKKFKKIAPGNWRAVYDSHTRGAKMAIADIRRKIAAAPDAQTMMRIVLENRDRFSDAQGNPLPFVQELSKYISSKQDKRDQEVKRQRKEERDKKKAENQGEKRKLGFKDFVSGFEVDGKTYIKKDGRYWSMETGARKGSNARIRQVTEEAYNAAGVKAEKEKSTENDKNIEEGKKKQKPRAKNEKPREPEKKEEQRNLIKEWLESGSVTDSEALKILTDKNFAGFMPKDEAKEFLRKKTGKNHDPEEGGLFDQTKSDFDKIREKYQSAKAETGDEDEIQVGKELIAGKWKLVEADAPAASHDETNFHKTPGFPTAEDGSTINDRDYGHDKDAQEIVMEIGADYDGRAVSVDNPVVVTNDGVVISGNNRTMSGKIAAKKGTDKGYIEALKRKAKKFGFTPEQVGKFKHPRVVFETAENKGYSTEQFAKFNKSSKKAMSPIEAAVKVSKTIKMDTVGSIAGKMGDFETLGELYADRDAVNDIFNTLQRDNIITSMDRPQYVVDGGVTGAGKEFLETVLIGSVINESNIRGLNREGCKSIRQKLVRAIAPLIENKGMDGYSVTKELNEAANIAMQVAVQKDKFKSVDDYARQKNLFGIEDDPISVELARKLEGTQKEFAAFMQAMNGGLKYAANGEADIFLGNVESREDILGRMLNLKKAIGNVIDFFRDLRAGKGPRFVKKAMPIRGENGETELSDRWTRESIGGAAPYIEDAGISEAGAKVVAVDFDGVINSYTSGWKGPAETDEPVLNAAESLKTLYNRGYKVVIFSTRANTHEGVDTIREYLRKHTENNDLADAIEITDKKPIADMYIDDRAIPFAGDWEEALKRIEEFKPWNEARESSPASREIINLPDGIYEGLRAAYGVRLDNGASFSTITGIRCSWNFPMRCAVEIKDGVPYFLNKSLAYSGYPLQGRAKVHGMDISIENKEGSVRSGTDKDGHDWSIKMNFDYGYIRGTVGKDKDHVDCYLGPNPDSVKVFVVHQNDPTTGEYDEDKVMLGFDSEDEARKAYLSQYDRPGFLGDIDEMDVETFKEKAFDPKNKGKRLTKALITEGDIRANVAFMKKAYEFFSGDDGEFNLNKNRCRLQNLEGFPKGLDLENCEPIRIDEDKIYFSAGGDWQQMVNFAVGMKGGNLRIVDLFYDVDPQDRDVFSRMKANIEEIGKERGQS